MSLWLLCRLAGESGTVGLIGTGRLELLYIEFAFWSGVIVYLLCISLVEMGDIIDLW